MPSLDLRLIRLFVEIYSTGSVTAAADRVGLSQPTVSIGLRQLRDHYNDPLFVSVSRGLVPTPLAEALISPARQTLDDFDSLSRLKFQFDPSQTKRTFRIAMSDASHLTLLPRLFKSIRTRAPHASVEAVPINQPDLAEGLAHGQIDVVIGVANQLDSGFYQRVLYSQRWVSLRRMGHPVRDLDMAQFMATEHIDVNYGTVRSIFQSSLAKLGLTQRIGLSMPGFLGLPSIVASSDLIVTLPSQIGQALAQIGGLQIADCPLEIDPFDVKMYWHTRHHADIENKWLRDVVYAELGKLADPSDQFAV